MVHAFGAEARLADAEPSAILCLFFLEVVLVLSVCFPFRNFCTNGALWPIRGFSVTGPYLIVLPLVLVCGGDVSINCKENNDKLIKGKDRCITGSCVSKKKLRIPR
jgi:hypothetical protein